ncbi:inactive purple acid phosphatase 27 [Micractinium conductrix]|uniref:Purple acid phosphatase n=1 Tax=Micractinium conductrix TaxID=554055 RepID=A0A2P6VHX5_9CHLO|nr:inactive purple acid phosphatase 27 [Micractinium conductrix]|eukprot:PSC73699.1 inactive purple acid phosphatase 27 [Micractinium conductrix]
MPSGAARAALALAGAAVLAAVAFAACSRHGPRRPGEAHNPLELWNVVGVSLQLQHAPGAPSIRCNASVLHGAAEWVTVTWSGLGRGRYDDYIALFPAGADPAASAPIKYHWAARSPSHIKLGEGSLSFRVLNMRHDMRFALVRGGLQCPTIAAWSGVLAVAKPNLPMQGHLSLMGAPREVMVQWVTRDAGAAPTVRWGTSPDALAAAAHGDSLTYSRADMCGAPANASGWMEPGMLHGAVMGGLQPLTAYYYQYGDKELGWSEVESFVSPPATGPGASVTLLAVADLGQAEEDGSMGASEMLASKATTACLAAEVAAGAQLLVHNGDISYARGFGSLWDRFFDQLAPTVRRVPYMTAVGNHERDWPASGDRFPLDQPVFDSGGECGIPYYRRTRMPTSGGEDAHWYSFDFGPIHFVQYSTEHLFEPGSPQHAWLEADLAAVDRSITPWVILGGHRPMYLDSTWYGLRPDCDQFVASQLRESLEGLLERYQVDVTWHGHHHSYQRTCPTLNERCVADNADGSAAAPVHLVLGHSGAGLTPNVHFFRPHIFKRVLLRHGYVRVTANATHLTHAAHVAFWDRDGDGVLWPSDTYVGFRKLGFNVFISLLAVPVIHGTFSWWTQNSWVPDPRFRIRMGNIHRGKHGSDSETYDTEGRFVPQKFEEIFSKYDRGRKGGLSQSDIQDMIQGNRNIWDFTGWAAGWLEWNVSYYMAAKDTPHGRLLLKDDVRGIIDGTIFHNVARDVEAGRLRMRQLQGEMEPPGQRKRD